MAHMLNAGEHAETVRVGRRTYLPGRVAIEVRALFLVMHVAAVTLNSLSAETIGDAYHLTSSIGLSTNPLASS
jgi:hypothetical protein